MRHNLISLDAMRCLCIYLCIIRRICTSFDGVSDLFHCRNMIYPTNHTLGTKIIEAEYKTIFVKWREFKDALLNSISSISMGCIGTRSFIYQTPYNDMQAYIMKCYFLA